MGVKFDDVARVTVHIHYNVTLDGRCIVSRNVRCLNVRVVTTEPNYKIMFFYVAIVH